MEEKKLQGPPAGQRVSEILSALKRSYPAAGTALNYRTPFQLLVAVLLSAQTTDKQVNRVTARLFETVKTPQGLLALEPEALEKMLAGCGLFRQKSRQLREASRILLEEHGGAVPSTREELVELPGVGRKTANVLLSTAFGIPAFAVDTHVRRVSFRLGLTENRDVFKVEEDLCRLIPRELWTETHHRLIAHGRRVCRARGPLCRECPLSPCCSYLEKEHQVLE